MAIYGYEFPACGERFELTMSMSQHDQLKKGGPECPKCGKATRQLVSDFSCKAASKY